VYNSILDLTVSIGRPLSDLSNASDSFPAGPPSRVRSLTLVGWRRS
jgi:hypothetical protein